MTTTPPPDEGVGLRSPIRGDLPHPPDTRPHRPPSASGTEKTFEQDGRRYTYRHVGWLGHRDGAFYAIGEQPADHEPGGWSPLYLLAFVEDVIAPDVEPGPAPVLVDIRPHLAGLNCRPGDVVVLAMTVDVEITAGEPVASEAMSVATRVDRRSLHPVSTDAGQAARHSAALRGPVGELTPALDAAAYDGPGPDAKRIPLDRDEAGQLWASADVLDRLFISPTPPPAAGDLVRVTLSPGERITDPDRAEALGLTVEARRLRDGGVVHGPPGMVDLGHTFERLALAPGDTAVVTAVVRVEGGEPGYAPTVGPVSVDLSPDADAVFIHVDDVAGTLNLTHTTGRALGVSVNGGSCQVDNRRRHTISYRTGEVVDAEPPRCDMIQDIHVMPHVGCILR